MDANKVCGYKNTLFLRLINETPNYDKFYYETTNFKMSGYRFAGEWMMHITPNKKKWRAVADNDNDADLISKALDKELIPFFTPKYFAVYIIYKLKTTVNTVV